MPPTPLQNIFPLPATSATSLASVPSDPFVIQAVSQAACILTKSIENFLRSGLC